MDAAAIKSAATLTLRPNKYLRDCNIPFNYQKRGSLLMLLRPRMVLGDDVGLGKTLESIVHFTYMKAANPRLRAVVLTEKIALVQWKEQFEWLTQGLSTKIVTANTHPDPTARVAAIRQYEGDVLISTYSLMYKYRKHVLEAVQKDGFVVYCDEPNVFKSTSSQIHAAMYEFCQEAGRVYGLTATVVENRLEEAFGIFRVVCPGLIPSKVFFEKEFCIKRKLRRPARWVICGYKNLDKFRKLIEPGFYGRLQDDPEVKQELPEVLPKDLPIELSMEQSRKVVEAMDRLVQLSDGSIVNIDVLPSLILAQQFCDDPGLKGFNIPSAKTEAVIDALQGSLSGERVLIYCNLRSMVFRLQAALHAKGIESVRITGKEKEQERELAKARFMSDGEDRCNILIGNRAIAKSANLQKSGHLIFYDLPWSYGIYRQMVGRLKRTGSMFKVIGVYRLLAILHPSVAAAVGTAETLDQYVLKTIMRKKDLFDAITGDVISIETSQSDVLEIWQAVKDARKRL